MIKRIEITVSPKGEVTVQTKGYSGSQCQQASKALEEALGLRQREELTAEYHQSQALRQELKA